MVDESAKADSYDPYVCFRRRETRIGRRTRRMDSVYVEKLRKLRLELNDAKLLMDEIVKRDKFKREILSTEMDLFEATMRARNIKRMLEECGVDIQSPSPVSLCLNIKPFVLAGRNGLR
jgi:enhancer of polycomb-like protein